MAQIFCAMFGTDEKFYILWKKILKKHFWTRRMQNRGGRVKTSEKNAENFLLRSEKDEEIAVLRKKNNFSSERSLGHFDWSFDYPNQN